MFISLYPWIGTGVEDFLGLIMELYQIAISPDYFMLNITLMLRRSKPDLDILWGPEPEHWIREHSR